MFRNNKFTVASALFSIFISKLFPCRLGLAEVYRSKGGWMHSGAMFILKIVI